MKLWGLEWSALDSYFQFVEQASSPGTPESNHIRLYAKDNGSSVSTLCYKNDAGTEVCMPTSGSFVTGTGVANRLTYWTGTSTLDDVPRTFTAGSVLFAHTDFLPQEDNANFFWNDTDNRLGLGINVPLQRLHVAGNARIQGAGTDVVLDVRGTANNLLNISETGTTALYKFAATGATNAFLSCADNFIVQIDSDANSSGDVFLVKHDAVSTGGTSLFSVSETGDVSACLPGGNLIIGGGATASRLRLLEASGSGTNYTEFVVQPQAANITYTLPPDDGDANEVLTTNGSGSLTWEPATATMAIGGTVTSGTTGSVLFVGAGPVLAQDNANFFWDDSGDKLVLGATGVTHSTTSRLLLDRSTDVDTLLELAQHRTGGECIFRGLTSRGTHASPTVMASGDTALKLEALIYDSSTYQFSSQIRFSADGTPAAGDVPGRITFWTTPAASATLAERLRIDAVGDIGAVAASRFRMQAQNRFRYLNSMAGAQQSSAQTSLAVNAFHVMTYTTEDFDTDTLHDTGSNTGRMTAAITGKYLCVFSAGFDTTNTTLAVQSVMDFFKNGTTNYAGSASVATTINAAAALAVTATRVFSLVAGDYIEGRGYLVATSGTWDSIPFYTYLQMVYLGE